VEMQKIGYTYCNEDLGVFGIHRHGPGVAMRLGNLFLWTDCIANFDPAAIAEAGMNPNDTFFQGLSYRMMWSLFWDVKRDALSFSYEGWRNEHDTPGAWHFDLLRAYANIESSMQKRTILEEGKGVIYQSDSKQILWAFTDFIWPLQDSAPVTDFLSGETTTTQEIKATRNRIYIIAIAE